MQGKKLIGQNLLWLIVAVILLFFLVSGSSTPVPEAIQTFEHPKSLDQLWLLLAAALVFLMQAGFLCFEVGSVREQNTTAVAMKNIADFIIVGLCFFAVGFALMFGPSQYGFWGGRGFFAPEGLFSAESRYGFEFFIFQFAFAATSVTIVSGALSGRTAFIPYLVISAVTGAIIYPIFGHWVWGNYLFPGNTTCWLHNLGYRDFAGSSVVHLTGGCVSLVGIAFAGPRLGRFGHDGEVLPIKSYSTTWTALGTAILWISWWGFNGGSLFHWSNEVSAIIVKTNIAAAASGLSAFVYGLKLQDKKYLNQKFLGGILGGLVAITACCDVVSNFEALLIGVIAGCLHNVSHDFILERLRLDDPVGAVSVHGCCGIFGVLCVAIFGNFPSKWVALGTQVAGILTCIGWSTFVSVLMFYFLRSRGLLVDPRAQIYGINITGDKPLEVESHKQYVFYEKHPTTGRWNVLEKEEISNIQNIREAIEEQKVVMVEIHRDEKNDTQLELIDDSDLAWRKLNALLLEKSYVGLAKVVPRGGTAHPEELWSVAVAKLEENRETPLFRMKDLRNFTSLQEKIEDGRDPVSKYIKTHFLQEENFDEEKLTAALNSCLRDTGFYERTRFAQIGLKEQLLQELDRELAKLSEEKNDDEWAWFNCFLLERAYPWDIVSKRFTFLHPRIVNVTNAEPKVLSGSLVCVLDDDEVIEEIETKREKLSIKRLSREIIEECLLEYQPMLDEAFLDYYRIRMSRNEKEAIKRAWAKALVGALVWGAQPDYVAKKYKKMRDAQRRKR